MAAVQALQNGEVSLINPQATADVLESLQSTGNSIQIRTGDGGTYEHVDIIFNNGGPFDPASYSGDAEKARKVRQAFLLTIPRQDIIDKIIKPNNPEAGIRQSYNLVPSDPNYADVVAASKQDTTYPGGDAAIEQAKKLLAEAGLDTEAKPIDVRFLFADNNTRRVQEYQLIQESAIKAGFNVFTINAAKEWGNLLSSPDRYDASLFGWQTTSRAVSEPAANFTTTGGNNFGGFSNAEIDALYAELAGCFDADRQKEINERVEAILVEEGFGTTIFQFPEITAWDARLKNVTYITLAPTVFNNFYEWQWQA
jgi:peptide/nickel transport system substrate-binding protein